MCFRFNGKGDKVTEMAGDTHLIIENGIQTNFPHQVLRDYGCHFFVAMKWLELHHKLDFPNDKLVLIFEEAARHGWVDPNGADILNGVGLLNYVLGRVVYSTYRRSLTERPSAEFCIRYLVKPKYTHFVIDRDGKVFFDPLDPYRPAAWSYTIDSYRVFM